MGSIFKTYAAVAGGVMVMFLSCCSTEKVQQRQDEKTEHYVDRQEARQIRARARQERSDAWFDRIMGEPVKSNDTGLKLP